MKYIQILSLIVIILFPCSSFAFELFTNKKNSDSNNFKTKQIIYSNKDKFISYRHTPQVIIHEPINRFFGLNIRFQGLIFNGSWGNNELSSRDTRLGGFGFSFRYRPIPQFAFDSGIDFIFGTDYNGFDRQEIPFSVNGLIYFNTENKIQPYIVGGVNWSSATVHSDVPSPLLTANKDGYGYGAEYSYFGGQFGVGCDFKIKPSISLNFDLVSFLRERTDINNEQKKYFSKLAAPEFINPLTGQTTNNSGGLLFRGGMTYWF